VDANIAMLYKGIPLRTASVIAYLTAEPLKNGSLSVELQAVNCRVEFANGRSAGYLLEFTANARLQSLFSAADRSPKQHFHIMRLRMQSAFRKVSIPLGCKFDRGAAAPSAAWVMSF
jgi:hypothetical protein